MEKQFDADSVLLSLRILTGVSVLIIIGAFIWSMIYIKRCKNNSSLSEKQHWIDELPAIISALGVLGTFTGITVGLYFFNTKALNDSIPLLLEGLKSAFLTSICGMVGSMVLNRVKTKVFDEASENVSDVSIAAGKIVSALSSLNQTTTNAMQVFQNELKQNRQEISTYYSALDSTFKSFIQEIQSQSKLQSALSQSSVQFFQDCNKNLVSIDQQLSPIQNQSLRQSSTLEDMETLLDKNEKIIINLSDNILDMHNYMSELMTFSEATTSSVDDISSELKTFGQKIHDEVVDIEGKMEDTNELLSNKFKEFSDLLKKSNTEALVEVMKSVTKEFQQQMSALINKLVQENFEQLNTSVERLNSWQIENKEMISSLTSQYKSMATEFEESSMILTSVVRDTQLLVSDGGKLSQLINSLSKLLIEDEHFIQISNKLSETVELSKSNFEQFDGATKLLNDWVRKQRNFVEGVQLLIEKLDELNKIRDYGEQFWQGTKRHMEEGVGFISDGARNLSLSLKDLDERFYNRLSTTLAELDACIQAMVKGK